MAWLHSQFSRWSVVAVLASPVFWGLDHCMLSHRRTIIQMVTRRFASREFAGRSSFGIKFANSSDAMPAWSVHRFFSLQGFPTFVGHISPYRWARNFDIVKLKFSFTLQSCWIITHILTAFSITFLTQFVKQRLFTPWSFLGLSSNVFTFDHLFTHRSHFFNNLAKFD